MRVAKKGYKALYTCFIEEAVWENPIYNQKQAGLDGEDFNSLFWSIYSMIYNRRRKPCKKKR